MHGAAVLLELGGVILGLGVLGRLAGRGWTVQIPGTVTTELERQGYR